MRTATRCSTGHRMGVTLWIVLALGIGAGCGQREGPPQPSAFRYPARLSWEPVQDVASYRVQAWSGYRLIFEETTADTSLVLTPSLLRAMAPFDSLEVQVRALREDGEVQLQRFVLRPEGEPDR